MTWRSNLFTSFVTFLLTQGVFPTIASAQNAADAPTPGPSSGRAARQENAESIVAPSRIGGYGYADALGMVAVGNGVVVGTAAKVGYVGQGPYRLQFQAAPFVMAFLDGASRASALFVAEPMLDTPLLGLGPAIGYAIEGDSSYPALGGTVRLGAIDGLRLDVRASALLVPVSQVYPVGTTAPPRRREWTPGELDLHAAIPLSQRSAFVLDATLRSTMWRTSIGLNARLTKTRGPGASFLTICLGFLVVDGTFALPPGSDSQDFAGGFMLGIGLARRI